MQKQVVTVFGGGGFIGRHVVRRLVATGAIVRVAQRDPEEARYLKPMGDVGQVVPVAANIRDENSVAAAVAGADSVINLVGLLYESGTQSFGKTHVAGARNVANAAGVAGVRNLVQMSAIGASPESEAAYARTKANGEKAVKKAFPDAVIIRPSIVFGPEDKFFNMFSNLARISPFLPVFGCPVMPQIRFFTEKGLVSVDLYGDGGTKFQPVYVGDVADAIVACLDNPQAKGETYELGGPTVYSSKELMALLLKTIGRRRFLAPIPFWKLMIEARFLELLPKPLMTRDQVKLLKVDNVVARRAKKLSHLGITPTAAEAILPGYLARYRLPRDVHASQM